VKSQERFQANSVMKQKCSLFRDASWGIHVSPRMQQRSAPEAGARLLWKAEAGKAVSARHIQQRMPRWKVYAVRLLSTTNGAPAADTRTATTAWQNGQPVKHGTMCVRESRTYFQLWTIMNPAQQHTICARGSK